ncbi:hypothetical protein XH86_35950 (plasmid) [Bradyrhizobium guangdongense]|nr:hypothetical protein XH86_35950 [Bradyrhizobium guangdongense]
MRRHGLIRLEYEEGGEFINIELAATTDEKVRAAPPATANIVVRAVGPGRFLPRHPAAASAAVPMGSSLNSDDILGYLQDDLILIPIRTPQRGRLVTILIEEGAAVSYGAPLFEILPVDVE